MLMRLIPSLPNSFSAEFDDIVQKFENAGIYVEVSYDEEGFIEWLQNGRLNFPRQTPFVYNLTQNGTERARLTTVAGLCRLYNLPSLMCENLRAFPCEYFYEFGALKGAL